MDMIKNFNEFVNESASTQVSKFSNNEKLNEPFANFFKITQEKIDDFKSVVYSLLHKLDVAIEATKEELEDVIVGEPNILVDDDLRNIEITFDTNVSSAEPEDKELIDTDENPVYRLENRVYELESNLKPTKKEIFFEYDEWKKEIHFFVETDKKETCVIRISFYFNLESMLRDDDVEMFDKIIDVVSYELNRG
jgi:hypothetical protein